MDTSDTRAWYHRNLLDRHEIDRLVGERNYHPMQELHPGPKQSKYVKLGDKLEVLLNVGMAQHYTVTHLQDPEGHHLVGRLESDGLSQGQEFCIDSSMGFCQDVGYKVIEKFP